MAKTYQAIIVGARRAGSPMAMLLARKGYRVLIVDRANFPSDTMSTHVVQPLGVAALSRWGLLDRLVATAVPPIDAYAFRLRTIHDRRRARHEGTPPTNKRWCGAARNARTTPMCHGYFAGLHRSVSSHHAYRERPR
jgi:2-polyprenyl-6-methoxyphenol hydroxylase-like FAD-dependent oxidoreductase